MEESREIIKCTYAVIGGGIAGVSCVEQILEFEPEANILLVSSSSVVKESSNVLAKLYNILLWLRKHCGGAPTSTATPPSFQFSAGTSAFTATSTPTTTAGVTATPGASLNTATTTTASSSVNAPQMNFRQLQELANKWTMELEEHERVFIEQATKVNSWDKTLMASGDKIAKLSDSVEKVKLDHMRLEHTLDFLKNQQREFNVYLEALESSVPENRVPDPEREYLHNLAENMDTQLQQMAEDLKDVIRHINDTNKPLEKADPVAQILKILNEHTDALQWVEDNTIAVKKSLDDVTKLNQMFRRDQERSFRLLYKK